MLLRDKVNGDIAAAMKAKEATRLSALRMLKAAIMNKGIEKANAEIGILEAYLPPAASAADIDAAIAEAIAETGASSVKDLGKVMKAVMPRLAGKNADGRAVNEAVRRKLGV